MNNFWTKYDGTSATTEILIMLLGAFLLGALLMWAYDKFLFECIEEEVEFDDENKDDYKNDYKIENREIKRENNFVPQERVERVYQKVEERQIPEVRNQNLLDITDLKIVEGIGPKIESILKSEGVYDLKMMSEMEPEEIKEILLKVGGERYAFHDPTTWPDQARLAAENKIDELKEYQDFLKGGRKS